MPPNPSNQRLDTFPAETIEVLRPTRNEIVAHMRASERMIEFLHLHADVVRAKLMKTAEGLIRANENFAVAEHRYNDTHVCHIIFNSNYLF